MRTKARAAALLVPSDLVLPAVASAPLAQSLAQRHLLQWTRTVSNARKHEIYLKHKLTKMHNCMWIKKRTTLLIIIMLSMFIHS